MNRAKRGQCFSVSVSALLFTYESKITSNKQEPFRRAQVKRRFTNTGKLLEPNFECTYFICINYCDYLKQLSKHNFQFTNKETETQRVT